MKLSKPRNCNFLRHFKFQVCAAVLCFLLSGCAAGTGWPVFGDKPEVSATGKETREIESSVTDTPALTADVDSASSETLEEDVNTMLDPGADSRLAVGAKGSFSEEPKVVHKMDRQFVGKRLEKYAGNKKQWNALAGEMVSLDKGDSWPAGWYKCVQDVEMLHFGYQRLHDVLDESSVTYNSAGQSISPWDILTKDIAYSESSCDSLQVEAQKEVMAEVSSYASRSLAQPVDLFIQYMKKRQYGEAIRTYESLIAAGGEVAELTIRQEYVVALRRSERYADAAMVLRGIIKDNFSQEDALQRLAAQREYADLLLITGNKEEAGQWYEKIENYVAALSELSDWVQDQQVIISGNEKDFAQYREALKAFYSFDGTFLPSQLALELDDGEPGDENAVRRSIKRLRTNAEERSIKWFKQQLLTLDELANDLDYEKAKMLTAHLLENASGAMREQLLMMQEHIAQSEEFDRQNLQQLREQSNETEWQKAVRALENKEYDTAIRLFSGVLYGEHGEEARAYIAKASDLAASDLRRRAASLFAKSRRTSDPLSKERLLTESRDLLQNLLGSYPDAAIVDKATRNLKVIEAELQKLQSSPEPILPDDQW